MDYHPLYAMNTYTRVCSEMDKKVKKDEKEKRLYIYMHQEHSLDWIVFTYL